MTTAKLLDGSPTSGGKDYTHKGEGNDAYENFVENLTIDVGAGNPGAIGIDYLANNIGAIRDVRVTAPPGSGAIGISMQRKWPGPALLQRVDGAGLRHRHRGRQYRIRRHARPRESQWPARHRPCERRQCRRRRGSDHRRIRPPRSPIAHRAG